MATLGILGQFEKGINRWLDRCFDDPELVRTVTYGLYKGQGTAEQTFVLLVARVKHTIEVEEDGRGIPSQTSIRHYLVRAKDLPTGITLDNFTLNDSITDGPKLTITKVDKTLEFVAYIEATGIQ
jgi:hypothetical protein